MDNPIKQVLSIISNSYYDGEAKNAGYDPESPKILSQLNIDYADLTAPINSKQRFYGLQGLTVKQITDGYERKKLLESLLDHYEERFGAPKGKK